MNKDYLKDYEFDEVKHIHKLRGKALTGVTTILGMKAKPALIQWSANEAVKYIENHVVIAHVNAATGVGSIEFDMAFTELLEKAKYAHRQKKEGAADFGTHVHNAIEVWIKEKKLPDTLTPEEQVAFDNFKEWAETEKVEFLESEMPVYSEKCWVGGICDFVAKINDKVWIGDIKTSSAIYPEYFWQTSAYQLAMQELGMYPEIEGHVIVNVKKNGKVDVERSYSYERNVRGFLACLELYRIDEALKLELPKKWSNKK
jgi:hypothetical protein